MNERLKILVDVPADTAALERLKQRFSVDPVIVDPIAEEEAIWRSPDLIQECRICFCTFPPTNLADMPNLQLVQIASSGYTQLAGIGLVEREVRACNARGVFDTAIAEWNIAMMVAMARRLPEMLANQRQAIWDRSARFQTELRGSTVGLWGYGGIGRQTARLCKALGLRVHVLTRSPVVSRENIYRAADSGDVDGSLPDRVFTMDQWPEFLRDLNFLILCMPLNEQTRGIVQAEHLQTLPRQAYLLNPARGPLVEEHALIAALRERRIAGAALDTHYYYPMPADHPLWGMDNVILTPHISGSSESSYFLERIWDLFSQNVERFLTNKPLLNELTSRQLSGA
ncbi:D-2-hydroxyacid dehydrogenase [Lacipirellula parvula]|uniref:D-3-phosphoglycerate dehydrogenase n=1 Tax=Lacipirellula parvula TaxID=2650471 RepID=A0A5K7XH60_9BACT|nr:D-2-hydroxyacid dehydrogenase [Lacipirellula parvula]BBO33626.1 D-3-phosphoglycerate dehydrogenase [Lacipirellula parvula]